MEEWEKFRDIVMECTDDVCHETCKRAEKKGVRGGLKEISF